MTAQVAVTLLGALVLAAANLAPRYLGPLHGPRTRPVVSLFGGVAVAYVFVHLLPLVAAGQETLEDTAAGDVPVLDRHAFLLALAGLAAFYGIEVAARTSRARATSRSQEARTEAETFVASMAAFVIYNALLGYVVVERAGTDGAGAAIVLTMALAVHVTVNDASLREHHQDRYEHVGRWVLATAVLAGWVVGQIADLPGAWVAAVVSFLAGGITLNVLKEELPAERESHFGAFAAGTAGGGLLLLVV